MSDDKPQNPWGASRPNSQKPRSELDVLVEMARQYQKNSGNNGGGANQNPPPRQGAPRLRAPVIPLHWILIAVVAIWAATGFYQVRPDQQGVVMRFGKLQRITEPGLNYHLPYPFETVLIPNVTRENRIAVGFDPRSETRDVPEESLMMTGDENIVDVDFVVTWQVKDIGKFLFRVRDPEALAKMAAESVMRETVGQNKIQDILTSGRQGIEARVQQELQQLMDEYETGILITRVNLRDAAPPQQVVDAFREVQRAQADAEQLKNQALSYQNDILPRARGEAERLVQEANGYKESTVAKASGEAQRFNSIYNAYQNAKEVTQKRMYLETMEEIYSTAQRIVIDKNAGSNTVIPLMLPGASGKMSTPAITPNPIKGAN